MKRVEFVAPSGNIISQEDIARAASYFVARDWGVELAASLYSSYQRFAGTSDRARLQDFNGAATDKDNSLVLCARGGYGMNRILPYIDFEGIKKAGTWVCGFSDITLFTAAYLAKCGGVSLQGPTASVLGAPKTHEDTIEYFFNCISSPSYTVDFESESGDVKADGILWGGNLTVLVSLLGTEYFPKIEGGILFLEDVGENAYKIERDLMHLVQAGVIERQSAVVLGHFSETRTSDHDFGYGLEDALDYFEENCRPPLVRGLPFGHIRRMCTLVVGAEARLEVKDGAASLEMLTAPNIA
jgi:muramoyltetrapeptide carboxypeptidase